MCKTPHSCLPDAPESFLAETAGYFTTEEPAIIHVRGDLRADVALEVRAHETFHRTLSTSTIYGIVFLTLDDFLRSCWNRIPNHQLRANMLKFRNRMFKGMVLVQEAGAVARPYGMQVFLRRPKSQKEMDAVHAKYLGNLPRNYRELGSAYVDFILSLFRGRIRLVAPHIFSYTNDVIAGLTMNALFFEQSDKISFDPADTEFFADAVTPNARLFTIVERMQRDDAGERFVASLLAGLENAFGLPDAQAPTAGEQLQRISISIPDTFEGIFIGVIDRAFQGVLPSFAVTQQDLRHLLVALEWMTSLHSAFKELVPDYVPPKITLLTDHAAKKQLIQHGERKF